MYRGIPKTLKYWVGVQQGLVSHPSSDGITIKNTLQGTCLITSTSFAPHLFLLGWLKLNLILLSDQLRHQLREVNAGGSCD